MEKETIFNPFFCGNNPLSGNFFAVMESCHLMTMTLLKALARCDNVWQCDKCVFGNFQSVQFIILDIILLIIAILVLNLVHGIKLFMAVNVNVFLGRNSMLKVDTYINLQSSSYLLL